MIGLDTSAFEGCCNALTNALHHASHRTCASVASFDDRKFARRAKRLGFAPPVVVPL